jgi:hypothetical protein
MPKSSIAAENQNPGTPSTVWDLSGPGSGNIEGFATDISVNGDGTQTVKFKINTNSSNYKIDIYRMGYYQGNGARLVATSVAPGGVWGLVSILRMPSVQAAPVTDSSIGLVDAGNWSVSASWAVPATAVSGVYIAHLVRQDGTSGENHIPFIVRDDGNPHDIVFQTSDTTWHAYNGWGGYSLYGGGATASSDGRGYKVSYNRPIATRDGVGTYAGPQDFLFGEEIAAIHWLEANGYDVCYMAGFDTDRLDGSGKGLQFKNAQGSLIRKVFLSVGHDEYWSGNQRANVEAVRAAGVHLAFWSGNEVFWKTRYEDSAVTTDGSPIKNRTLVCYKETRDDTRLDPLDTLNDPSTCTCTWRDVRFCPPGNLSPTIYGNDPGSISPQGDAGKPENALTGTIFEVDDFREDQILIPYPMTRLRFWRNSKVAATASGNSGMLVRNYLGYEWDESPITGRYSDFRPAGLIHLSLTSVSVNTYLLDYGHTEGPGIATHSLSLYRHPSGALVFAAGTVMWSWGLDPDHDPDPKDPTQTPTDLNVQQAMVNLLADMGVFWGTSTTLGNPAYPPGDVVKAATKSADTTPPVSTITSPANGASLMQNQTITITGTATDTGGQVGVVEVSTDGGSTWQPASPAASDGGYSSWSYNWTPASASTVTIGARATDDSCNHESPGPSISVTVAGATGNSLFNGNDTPAVISVNDPNPVELGVKFQSSQAGNISAIRFYKGPSNIGTHVGNLWSNSGAKLTSATFSNETSSGWQQVNLASPVLINASTIYVVSYHTSGNYSADNNYFTAAHTNGPLTAPATGASGGNGVYLYGSGSGFPTNSFLGSNYWVDVVFNPGASSTWTISGSISPGSAGAGATLGLSGASTGTVTADSSGNYSFPNLVNGTYTVTPAKSGYTFSPASQPVTINGSNVMAVNFNAQVSSNPLATDAITSRDGTTASSTISTAAFSTKSGNELLLAFVSTDYLSGANTTVTGVSGAGLTWVLVGRTNLQSGTAEIWRAFATSALSGATVTASLSQSVVSSLTVMSFAGVNTSGTNGSGAIGAIGTGNSPSGAPTASLATTRNGSMVLGVGNDYDNAISRTPGANQQVIHQYLAPTGDTYWVQTQTALIAASGTLVTINDTAPNSDRYNLTICEILSASG